MEEPFKGKWLLIVEGGVRGHRVGYLHSYCACLMEMGFSLVVCAPGAMEIVDELSHQFRCGRNRLRPIIYVDQLEGVQPKTISRLIETVRNRWRHVNELIRISRSEQLPALYGVLLLALGDYISPMISHRWLEKVVDLPVFGVHINPVTQVGPFPRASKVRFGVFRHDHLLSCRIFGGVGTLVETAIARLRLDHPRTAIVSLPDFSACDDINNRFNVREQIDQIRRGRSVLACVGAMSRRKNTKLVLELANASHESNWLFVVAGSWQDEEDADYRREMASLVKANNNRNLIYHPLQIPTDADFNSIVDASDILWANYEHFFASSNMLAKAAVFKKQVLVRSGGVLGTRVTKYRLGHVVKSAQLTENLHALERMRNCPSTADFEGYLAEHSKNELRNALRKLLLGIKSAD